MPDEPLRSQTAFVIRGGLKNQAGTLLLYPDRLSHVASNALAAGAAGGALGSMIASGAAKKRAAKKEQEGAKGVTTIALDQISEIRKAKQGLNKNILEVVAADGTALKLGVKFDKWKPDLVAALGASGRQVHDAGDVVTLS
ncbi:MAG: hypothetical protein V7605_1056 [Acidimicrobiaceae bacterium]